MPYIQKSNPFKKISVKKPTRKKKIVSESPKRVEKNKAPTDDEILNIIKALTGKK